MQIAGRDSAHGRLRKTLSGLQAAHPHHRELGIGQTVIGRKAVGAEHFNKGELRSPDSVHSRSADARDGEFEKNTFVNVFQSRSFTIFLLQLSCAETFGTSHILPDLLRIHFQDFTKLLLTVHPLRIGKITKSRYTFVPA